MAGSCMCQTGFLTGKFSHRRVNIKHLPLITLIPDVIKETGCFWYLRFDWSFTNNKSVTLNKDINNENNH